MITKAQITRRADADGVPAQAVERDYVLAHVLGALARRGDERLVFKGGTALRFCFLEECRYSADLDLSLVGVTKAETLGVIGEVLADAKVQVGLEVLELDDGTPPRIRFVGPLGRERLIKLDLADDELVIETRKSQLFQRWPDMSPDAELVVYSATEITGEKLRCVIQRLQCRDLLDLHSLFEVLSVDPAQAALRFGDKARHRSIDPETFEDRYQARLADYQERWVNELSEHVADVPHFDGLERRVSRALRDGGLIS
jgi:predicted nucleotidyltransferase component of viral defense system